MSRQNTPRTFRFITLGCKVNQYDSQAMSERVEAAGLSPAPPGQAADLVVVNTCTVTRTSDDKCRRCIRKAIRNNPQATIVVAGCYVDRDRAAVEAIPGVAIALSNEEKPQIEAVARRIAGELAFEPEGRPWCVSGFAGHSRAFVKIQDGCDSFCTYCIVPHVRGRARSRPIAEVVAEVKRLAESGFAEVVLTGIHVGHYGKDLPGDVGLAAVVRSLLAETDAPRLRLSSIEVMEISDDLLDAMRSSERVCPHLHVPLQSGDDEVLARMNRRYSAEDYLRQIDRIRGALDRPAISSDVMVGFPGETEAQFRHTVEVCRAAGFCRMHVFPFSPREGTPAAAMPDACPRQVITRRKTKLGQVAAELQRAFEREWEGERAQILVETKRDRATGKLRGYSERYILAHVDCPDSAMGRLVPVRLTRSRGGHMDGEIEPSR